MKFSSDFYRLLMYQNRNRTFPHHVSVLCVNHSHSSSCVALMNWLTCQSITSEVNSYMESNIVGPCGKAETLSHCFLSDPLSFDNPHGKEKKKKKSFCILISLTNIGR